MIYISDEYSPVLFLFSPLTFLVIFNHSTYSKNIIYFIMIYFITK
jgi:hypothetical protein